MWTPSRRSHCFTSTPAPGRSRWAPPAATCAARTARIGRSPSAPPSSFAPNTASSACPLRRWCLRPSPTAFRQSPTPTTSRLRFTSTCTIPPNSPALGKWLEIVYLVVPTVNDNPKTIEAMAKWLVKVAGPYIPLHFSRFFPAYRLKNLPATPISTLRRCRHIARQAGLKYVYVGNISGSDLASTYCPSCGQIVIKRDGYQILARNIKASGACRFCGTKIHGIW